MVSPSIVQLSPMDATMNPFAFTVLYVFPRPRDPAKSYDLQKLHDSFCELMDQDFPILLGEMHIDNDTGVVSIRPRANAMDARAAIGFAKDQIETLTSQQAMDERPMSLMPSRGLLPITLDRQQLCSASLIAVKCTLLGDGGLAIGVDLNHAMMDAQGIFTLMAVWGARYRGVDRHEISHDRQLLAATGSGAKLEHPEFVVPTAESFRAAVAVQIPVVSCTQQVFRLSRSTLQQIKRMASNGSSSSSDVPFISTLDAVTALFAILVTQARAPDKQQQSETVRVMTSVNGRNRLDPPLPKTYIGNAVAFALSTYDTAKELLAPLNARALALVAQRIRESINQRDDAFFRDSIEYVAQQRDWASVKTNCNYFFGPDVMFTSWAGLGIYEADFGAQPWYVGLPRLPLMDGIVLFVEGMKGADAIDVVVGLEAQTMKRLEKLWTQTTDTWLDPIETTATDKDESGLQAWTNGAWYALLALLLLLLVQ